MDKLNFGNRILMQFLKNILQSDELLLKYLLALKITQWADWNDLSKSPASIHINCL